MVYKRYIKKNGKLYGPYEYKSKKVDGKVVSEYLGGPNDKSKKKISQKFFLFSLVFILIIAGIFLISNFNSNVETNYESLEINYQDVDSQQVLEENKQNFFNFLSSY